MLAVLAAALKSVRKVDIHYGGKDDKETVERIVAQLRTAEWIAFSEYDPSGTKQVPQDRVLWFKNQDPKDALFLQSQIAKVIGKSIFIQQDNQRNNSFYGVWLKPLAEKPPSK